MDLLPFYLRMTSNVLCCNTLRNAGCFDSCRTIHTVLEYYTAITEYNNRADIFTLVKGQRRLDVRKYFLPEDHPCMEYMSTDCVHASGVNMFKNGIDTHIVILY